MLVCACMRLHSLSCFCCPYSNGIANFGHIFPPNDILKYFAGDFIAQLKQTRTLNTHTRNCQESKTPNRMWGKKKTKTNPIVKIWIKRKKKTKQNKNILSVFSEKHTKKNGSRTQIYTWWWNIIDANYHIIHVHTVHVQINTQNKM